jgi:SAM-dependent methyltransferase
MRSDPRPACAVCGAPGKSLYNDLQDRLFNAPGTWTLARCSNESCRTLWLDPMPLADDLGEAYREYFTHSAPADRRPSLAKRAYLAARFGAPGVTATGSRLKDGVLAALFAMRTRRRMELDDQVFHLRKGEGPQRVLDIGCGSGHAMELLSSLGWDAVGVEFDPQAAEVGRSKGLTIFDGDVSAQGFAGDSFDAVVLSHVIEHLPQPLATLREIHRLLKPGGRLVMLTPNADGLGHRRYGRDWMALDPPRHLHIFTPESMAQIVRDAGFAAVEVTTSACGSDRSAMLSEKIRSDGRADMASKPGWLERRKARLFHAAERLAGVFDRRAGDELVAKASK